ncbi:MAG: PKD domain-containing protein, partial [Bacteroidia bacterium]|nr:PKD domain-containing protein [Bacteroidia bacterium]
FSNTSTGASSYLWDFGDASTSNNINPLHIYTSAGAYDVKLMSITSFGCKDSLIKQVNVRPKPISSFSINNTAQCLAGNDFIFTNTTTGASNTLWKFGDAAVSNLISPSHSYAAAGIYYVKLVSSTTNGCKDSITKTITVHPQPLASFLLNDSSQCENENEFVFTNTSTVSVGSLSYYWDLGDGTTNAKMNNTHNYASAGIYTVWLKAISVKNCSDSIKQVVVLHANPNINLGADDTIYNAESKTLNAGAGFDSYLWSTNETTSQITVDSTTYGLGDKTFWVKVNQNGCEGSDTIQISIIKTVSIKETKGSFDIKVYPNPVNNLLTIELGSTQKEAQIMLTDMYGKQIKISRVLADNSTPVYQFDVSELAKGIYYLGISNSDVGKVTKIVKY